MWLLPASLQLMLQLRLQLLRVDHGADLPHEDLRVVHACCILKRTANVMPQGPERQLTASVMSPGPDEPSK